MRAAHASSSAGDAGSQTKMRRRLGVSVAAAEASTAAAGDRVGRGLDGGGGPRVAAPVAAAAVSPSWGPSISKASRAIGST